jgi:hypothetical protein
LKLDPTKRRRELTLGPSGPWKATITVDAVRTNHGRHSSRPTDWLFEVQTEWTGPSLPDFEPSDEPAQARDIYVMSTLEDARQLAHQAHILFRAGGDHPPDLRRLAGVG